MVANPVCHGLNQHRFILIHTYLPGGLGGIVDGKDIVAIDADGVHPVTRRAGDDAVAFELVCLCVCVCVYM